jgi:hypothetical protein
LPRVDLRGRSQSFQLLPGVRHAPQREWQELATDWQGAAGEKRGFPAKKAGKEPPMKTAYGIPQSVIDEVAARDVVCAYCRTEMIPEGDPARKGWANRSKWTSIEHLNHLPTAQHAYPMTPEYFVIACFGCNASRRDKPLAEWVDGKGIRDTVAPVVKAYLARPQASLPIDPACLLADRLAAEQRRADKKARRHPEEALLLAA